MLNDFEHERHNENRLQEICGGLVDHDTWNLCCIICPLYQQSVTNIVPGPRPGTPLFGSIKHPFQGFSFFLWTSMRTKTIQERFPLRRSYSTKGPAFFHLFKLLSPYDPFFSNPYIYDCESLYRYYIFFFAINRSSNRTLCKNYQWWISFHIALLMLWYLYVENIKTFEIMWTQSSISHILRCSRQPFL